MRIGFCLSSEQFSPADLIRQAADAENAGFAGLMISDHLQPWIPSQGHSGHVWSILGAVGASVSLPLSTGVSTPAERSHPVVLAQAAATLENMFPGRFTLGLGIGEALNEHILSPRWPEPKERVKRLLEAVQIIKRLWGGEEMRFKGEFFQFETMRLYSLPAAPPKLMIATAGPYLCAKTAEIADVWLTAGADASKLKGLSERFRQAASGKARSARLQVHVSWDPDYDKAVQNAVAFWPNGGLNFSKGDVRFPSVFAEMAKMVRPEHFSGRVLITSESREIAGCVRKAAELGFDEVYLHCIGPDQSRFMAMCRDEVLPQF